MVGGISVQVGSGVAVGGISVTVGTISVGVDPGWDKYGVDVLGTWVAESHPALKIASRTRKLAKNILWFFDFIG